MRNLLFLAALLASACGPEPKPALPERKAEKPAPPPGTCSVAKLPDTGLCADGDPKQFHQVSNAPLLAAKCVWSTEQLRLSTDEYLVFRDQDCPDGWDVGAYRVKDGRVEVAPGADPAGPGIRILDIFKLKPGEDAQAFSLTKLSTAPEAERKRCIVQPVEDGPFPGTLWQLAPNEEFLAELDQSQEPWSACGDYGTSPPVSFWEARGGYALFHTLGFDAGNWDPASFTFYRRDAGSWVKQPD